jgi:hypothetical protein
MKTIIFSLLLLMTLAISAQTINLNQTYTASTSIKPFNNISSISSLTIIGSATLLKDTGIVRIILVDNNLNEYLLYEGHLFTMTGSTMTFNSYTDETKYLNNITPVSILIIAKYATVTINSIQYVNSASPYSISQIQTLTASYYKSMIDTRITTMNTRLAQLGYKWNVCAQKYSYLSYSIKRNSYGKGTDEYNNYSEEHYKNGILDLPPLFVASSQSGLKSTAITPSSFDWRTRHGSTSPSSPYFNSTPQSYGWMTGAKDQDINMCGSCVIFSTVGMVENIMNLYYNRHLDYDLSEQAFISCNRLGYTECTPNVGYSFPDRVLTDSGIIKESCYPYIQNMTNTIPNCSTKTIAFNNCSDKEIVKINNLFLSTTKLEASFVNIDVIKKRLVKYGPIRVSTKTHSFLLVGWKTNSDDGSTIWISKDSQGTNTGDIGFIDYPQDEIKTIDENIRSIYTNELPSCVDFDRDGFYKWTDFSTCPSGISNLQDSDDNNNTIGPNGSTITPRTIPVTMFTSSVSWTTPMNFDGDVIIAKQILTYSPITIQPNAKITIKSGGTLGIIGDISKGSFSSGNIIIEKGGKLKTTSTAEFEAIKINPQYATIKDYNLPTQDAYPMFNSTVYNESDRICVDMDGDGYYNWGIGLKPASCPPCAPDIEDADDWNTSIVSIDEYGNPTAFTAITTNIDNFVTSQTLNTEKIYCGDLDIINNCKLTLSSTGTVRMQASHKIYIESGSTLTISGGKTTLAGIEVKAGGTLNLINNGIIEITNPSNLTIDLGGVFNQSTGGTVNIVNPFAAK